MCIRDSYLYDLNEIVELLVETVCAKRKTTRISGADFPHEIVRSRFLKMCIRDRVTGKKMDQKIYHHHSDHVGGMKEVTLKEKMAKKPEQVIELAVKGMLPKGPLGRQMYTKLHVYAGSEHKHQAQKPEVLTF